MERSIFSQLRQRAVALISLFVALIALGYNTWRNELTEFNRNVRQGGFTLITELAGLQQVMFYARYNQKEHAAIYCRYYQVLFE